mmetsp:Transcript_135153/g.431470  ORF Transcript_135153/g.431470 Transcript_135153/m.431470 type:complete len:241 (+) Transcript_135153:3789-4511(+)
MLLEVRLECLDLVGIHSGRPRRLEGPSLQHQCRLLQLRTRAAQASIAVLTIVDAESLLRRLLDIARGALHSLVDILAAQAIPLLGIVVTDGLQHAQQAQVVHGWHPSGELPSDAWRSERGVGRVPVQCPKRCGNDFQHLVGHMGQRSDGPLRSEGRRALEREGCVWNLVDQTEVLPSRVALSDTAVDHVRAHQAHVCIAGLHVLHDIVLVVGKGQTDGICHDVEAHGKKLRLLELHGAET